MNIVFVIRSYVRPKEIAGSVRILTHNLARKLAERGHIATVLFEQTPGEPPLQVIDGVYYKSYQMGPFFKKLERIESLTRRAMGLAKEEGGSIRATILSAAVSRERPDVIHIHNRFELLTPMAWLNPNSSIVLHLHSDWFDGLNRTRVAKQLKRTSVVLGCSKYVTKRVSARLGQVNPVLETLENGIDINAFQGKPRRRTGGPQRILFVGRLSPEKGLHVALTAFEKLAGEQPDVVLDIVGKPLALSASNVKRLESDEFMRSIWHLYRLDEGQAGREYYPAQLKKMVPDWLRHRVFFHGKQLHSKLVDFYQEADVVIIPSIGPEAFGMPAVEAMAAGAPVIATRTGGLQEIIEDRVNGLLVNRGDSDGLAAALKEILTDDKLGKRLAREGRRKSQQGYSWDVLASRLEKIYADAVKRREGQLHTSP